MRIVTMHEYYEEMGKFLTKHKEWRVITSPFSNDQWCKDYLCEDGAMGKEINRVVYETVEVEVKGIKVKVSIKLLETEWFDTDNGYSIYMYAKY